MQQEEKNWVQRLVPITDWIRGYNPDLLKNDLSAGLTVGVMLIPQGMAYAFIAGLPAIYGLYASIVPLIIYAIFGTSRQLAVGPVAMVSLLVAAGVSQIADVGSDQYIHLAILTALLVGIFQFMMGAFRLGFVVQFLSHPVLAGFTSAAALIIGLSQLKHLLGVDIPRSNYIHEILMDAIGKLEMLNMPTLIVGLASIALIIGLKRWKPSFPSALVVVAASTLAVWGLDLNAYGVQIVGDIPQGLPGMSIPDLSWSQISALIPTVLTISLVGFMESYAVAKAVANRHPEYKVDSNQELIGLGLANVFGSLFQSYPTTGGFSRTAVNEQAGAKTGMASIISAGVIALTVLFLTPLFYFLPKAVLAAIIMVAVFGLIDLDEAKFLWKTQRQDFAMMMVTFVATLTLGIEEGIGVGVIVSLGMVIYRSSRPHMAVLGRLPDSNIYRNVERFPEALTNENTLVVRIDASLYFANVDYINEQLQEMEQYSDNKLQRLIIDANGINHIDSSAIHALKELIEEYRDRNVEWYFSDVKGPVRDAFQRSGITEAVGSSHFYKTLDDAVNDLANGERESPVLESTMA
ncbi:MAG: SulP family inorganic anion transporter [Bacteroidota bacterium]